MITSPDHAVYRIRRFIRKGDKPKKYRKTFEVSDEHSGQVMALSDLVGRAVFATTVISDQHQHIWQMKPNRRIMPSRWTLTDPQGQVVLQFDQKILGKLANPLYKVVLAIIDADGREPNHAVNTSWAAGPCRHGHGRRHRDRRSMVMMPRLGGETLDLPAERPYGSPNSKVSGNQPERKLKPSS